MKRPHFSAFLLLIAVLIPAGVLRAQTKESDIQYRLGQSYEQGGDAEAAVKIYEPLYAKDTSNVIVFDALRRGYMQLKKYNEAAALINNRLARHPQDMMLLAQLGRVYQFLGDEQKANDAWDKAIAIAPKNEASYRIVAGSVMESRMLDKAIQIFLQGRKTLGKPGLFATDLAYLYSSVLNFPEATREYLNIIREDPNQFGYIQSRIASYTSRPEGLKAAVTETETRLEKDPNNELLLQMLSWLYMEGRQYDAAFDIERRLDQAKKSQGMQIYVFADRALREHAIGAAARAYQELITKYPQSPMIAQARFGYARVLEDSSTQQDTLHLFKGGGGVSAMPASEAEPAFRGAIAAYRAVVNEYPRTEIAARSLLQIARLMYERFFNLDEARSALETITTQYAGFVPVLMDAEVMLGDVFLASGDLAKAEAAYSKLLTMRIVNREMQEKAQFRLAQLAYYRGKFSDALNGLQNLSKNAADDITNDALDLALFIQENQKADSAALKEYASADLLQHQHKLSEALGVDEEIRKKYASTPLIDETLMDMGDLLTNMGRYADAVASYDSLIAGFPESIVLDRALMKKGRIYQHGLHDNQKAIDAFQQLLVKYPNSIYASEARRAIRQLRGDTL